MGSTVYRPTQKEIDIALRHGNADQAWRLLNESRLHPESVSYRLREALIALRQGDLNEATHCITAARDTGNLSPNDEARYLRHEFRARLRLRHFAHAQTTLDQLSAYYATNEGWLTSMRGRVSYTMAIYHGGRRSTQIEALEEAVRHLEAAERLWSCDDLPERAWRINNRWMWFKAEWRLAQLYHRSSQTHLRRLDNLRWDVIDNDPSGFRQMIARLPWLLFSLAEKA